MEIGIKLFDIRGGRLVVPRSYQKDAYRLAMANDQNRHFEMGDDPDDLKPLYIFDLKECRKFPDLFILIRQDGTLSGVLGPRDQLSELYVFGKDFVTIGAMSNETHPETAGRNIIAEYSGNVAEIKKGDTFYRHADTKNITIGWHGSYNPPCGMM